MDWELNFMWWANQWWSSPVFDYSLPWLTYLGSHFAVIVFIILSSVFTRQRKVFRHLFLLYGIQSAVIYSLKFLICRKRPFLFLEIASKLSKGPGEILDPSFPSAHASYSFMMATILSHWFPRYRIIFFISAGFIGFTRIYLCLHYPTDVIVGAFLGYVITRLLASFFLSISGISDSS
jgi:undecaprenyl-diphosphatase